MKTVHPNSNDRDVSDYVSPRSQQIRFNEANFIELKIRLIRDEQELKKLKRSIRRLILSVEDESLVKEMLHAVLGLLQGDRYAADGLPSLVNQLVNIIFNFTKLIGDDQVIYDLFIHNNPKSKEDSYLPQGYLTIEQIDEAIREVKAKAEGGENANSYASHHKGKKASPYPLQVHITCPRPSRLGHQPRR